MQDSCNRAGNVGRLRADDALRRVEFHFAPDCNGPPVPAGAAAPPNQTPSALENRSGVTPWTIRYLTITAAILDNEGAVSTAANLYVGVGRCGQHKG